MRGVHSLEWALYDFSLKKIVQNHFYRYDEDNTLLFYNNVKD